MTPELRAIVELFVLAAVLAIAVGACALVIGLIVKRRSK